MRLAKVAMFFDDTPCANGYTGVHAFFGQLALYDDTKRDSEVGERRVISVAPSSVIPARRVVSAAGTRFIIGHASPDVYAGKVIRLGLVAHEATDLVNIRTLAQACDNVAATSAWCGRAWIKSLTDNEQSSNLVPQFNVHFSVTEAISPGQVLLYKDGTVLLVRTVHDGAGGTRVVLADVMPGIEVGTITVGSYNKVTEVFTGSSAAVRVLKARWQSLYTYRNYASPKFGPEDLQLIISSSVAIVPGAKVTLSDGIWQIDSAFDEAGVWKCRAVRHG